MRHYVSRALRVLLSLFVFLLSVFAFSQSPSPKKPTRSSGKKASPEITVQAEEGPGSPLVKVKTPIRKERQTMSANRDQDQGEGKPVEAPSFRVMSHPREDRLVRGHAFHGDLRTLPQVPPEKFERPEFEEPARTPVIYPGTSSSPAPSTATTNTNTPAPATPAPTPSSSFEGLDFLTWGAGHPPDTNGDVGPTYYIQTINTSIGIFRKSDGARVTAFTFNSFFNGHFGNLCDTKNFGDPVVVYDTFEDRWIITDFAFTLGGGAPVAPEFQCFAVSQSGDPVGGGWNFYSIQINGGFDDYPKFGIWPDGLYMSANVFSFGAGGAFQNVRVWAFNKAQMYAGSPTVQIVSFDAPTAEFSLLPSNARLQTGTPPAGSPNYFASVFNFLNVVTVYKFHVDWGNTANSTLTGPFQSISPTNWSQFVAANQRVPTPNNPVDSLYPRLMVQNQYSNNGSTESLWDSHTVGATGATSTQAAVRYYQVDVTGGTVATSVTQAFTYSPDATVHRFMPSVDVDRAGNMAIGYSAANATLNPAIRYAGRLAGDPVNSITQDETSLIEGTASQTVTNRWGDYSAMTLDPDGCTFWYTTLYYQTVGGNFNTRIGAFSFPSCTPFGAGGTVSGTVTVAGMGSPISGATVALGGRSATTAGDGTYSFTNIPAGTYPIITAGFPGYNSVTVGPVVVTDGSTTTEDFSLTLASTSGCIVDTSQGDFEDGVVTNCDLVTSPGDILLRSGPDQQNISLGGFGVAFSTATWGGQTFTPSVTGPLTRVDINLFCSGCTGTTPDLTLSVRATIGSLPTGGDLASANITGVVRNAAFYTATFGSPATLNAGTQYALVIRPTVNPSAGTYALTRSGAQATGADVYSGGTRVSGATSGTVWSIPLTPATTGVSTDAGFKVFIGTGFPALGTFVSSLKDANDVPFATPNWLTLSWTATTPANTAVQFQVAASHSPIGPFNFVGPDGTAGTFFNNGDSLAQFNGNRYLKYQASLSSTDTTATPTLSDVTICFNNVPGADTSLVVDPATGTFGGTANLSATLISSGNPVSGKTVTFTLNGNSAGSGVTDGSGIATVSGVSLTGINAGSYPGAVAASFAGSTGFQPSSGSATLTVNKADQAITFNTLADKTFGDADFTVSATASSGLAVTFGAVGNCSVAGSTVHITGAGSCTITASQAGDGNNNPAPDVPQSFSIAKASQTITFGALADKTFGDTDFTVSATASSGLTVTFGAAGNCSVTGSTVHLTGAGSCTITASQAGDANNNPAADVPQSFSIAKANQTITFGALADKTFGDADFSVSATASSGLTVTFAAGGNCSITGPTVHITGAGSCTITASQAGDSNYNAAADVPQLFSIAKASQTITFGALADKTFGDADFTVSATASSGLTVTFAAGSNCSVVGSTVHITAAGSCTITASQAGDANYNAATDVPQSFAIAKASQTITFGALAGKTFGDPDFTVSATSSSGLTVTFAAGSNCSVVGSTVHITGGGSCTITASQAGDSNYNAAPDVPQTFPIAKAAQTITFGALGGKTFGDPDFSVSASASSGLAVTFGASGSCSVVGSTVHITGGGSCIITASQAGDSNYNPAADVPQSFPIAKENQTITFGALANKTFGNPDFSVSATASSTLAVSFGASGNCSVAGSTVHITGAGSCIITASQAGNGNFNPAADVPQAFTIAMEDQTITFGALPDKTFGDPDFAVSATSTSGLTVGFHMTGNCSGTGSTVHITSAGSCSVTATQIGDANFNPAPGVTQSFNIAKASQTITFAALSNKLISDPDFTVSATASSGLAVSFAASGGACSVSGATVHLTAAGTCTITASQAGDLNHNPATNVPRSFTVSNPDFTISPTLTSVTVQAGQSATEHITFSPNPGISNSLSFACSGLPSLAACTFTPSTVPAGSTQADVVLTIATTAPTAALAHSATFYATWLPFGFGLIGIVVIGTRGRKRRVAVSVATLAMMLILLIGCGGHATPNPGKPGTPPGTYPITVTGTSGSVSHSTSFNLTVN